MHYARLRCEIGKLIFKELPYSAFRAEYSELDSSSCRTAIDAFLAYYRALALSIYCRKDDDLGRLVYVPTICYL